MRGSVENGDLLFKIKSQKHDTFIRNDLDISINVPITLSKAMLGGSIEIPTIYEKKEKIDIKPGTKHNDQLIIEGLGLKFNNLIGNFYINFKIVLPKNVDPSLTDKVKKLNVI